jgi:hypothetical protein
MAAQDLNDAWRQPDGKERINAKLDAAAMENINRRRNGPNYSNGKPIHFPKDEPQPPPPDDAVPDGFTADGLEIAKPLPQLIKGVLPQRGTALIVGQSKAGKTFVVTDLAVATASGQDFFGKPVKRRGGVVIIAAEGMGGRARRSDRGQKLAARLPAKPLQASRRISRIKTGRTG